MKNKRIFIVFLAIAILGWKFHGGLKPYILLVTFDINSSSLSEERKNFHLRQVIDSSVDMAWNHVENELVENLKPRGTSVVKTDFKRGASLPTGQIILEFLTVDNHEEKLIGYLDVVYAKKIGDKYNKVGYFRKFLP